MKKKLAGILIVIVVVFLTPLVFNDALESYVIGPSLIDLNYSEVTFINEFDSTRLGGLLFIPEREGPYPVAVIIQGSGYSSRNNAWYLAVAGYLQSNGIAVMLPDKRGSEKSSGTWIGASLELLATDTESAVKFIESNSGINYSNVGLIGMSQGGWIAPIVASRMSQISFVVDMSGATLTSDEQLLFEEYHNIAPYTYSFIARLIAPLSVKLLEGKKSVAALLGFDPIPYWEKVQAPVFIAYGSNDTNCPVEESIERLKKSGLDHFQIRVYPNGGHPITDRNTGKVSGQFLSDLNKFISCDL